MSIFALLLNMFSPATVVMAEEDDEKEEKPEILSAKHYGLGIGAFGEYEIDAVIEGNEIVFHLPKDYSEEAVYGLDLNGQISMEWTEGATAEIEGRTYDDLTNGTSIMGLMEEANTPYKVILEKNGIEEKYTVTFKTWEPEKPEILSVTYGDGEVGEDGNSATF